MLTLVCNFVINVDKTGQDGEQSKGRVSFSQGLPVNCQLPTLARPEAMSRAGLGDPAIRRARLIAVCREA